jgi:hypothetical protein
MTRKDPGVSPTPVWTRNSLRTRQWGSGDEVVEDGGPTEDAIGIGRTSERGRPPEDAVGIGEPRAKIGGRIGRGIAIAVLITGIPVPPSHDVSASAGMRGGGGGRRVTTASYSGMTASLSLSRGWPKDGNRGE